MTFLNAVLLGGLAAGSIPIIIHFFHRRRVRVIRWGAMHFLETAIRKHSRRLRLEQLILLLLRCAIPMLLALALARPVLNELQGLVGNAKSSVVLLLDNSYSMDYGGGENSNFQQAREIALKKLEALPAGSEVAVVLLGGGVAPHLASPTVDLERARKELAQLEAGYGRAQMPAALEQTAQVLGRMQHAFREVIVVSDFQRINWPTAEESARRRAVEALGKLPAPPQLTFLHTGAEGRDNLAVEALEFPRLIAGVGQPIQIRATLRNFSEQSRPDLRVLFRVNGKERTTSQVTLAPGERRQLLFTHAFEGAGSQVIEVMAEADSLQADNSAQASIPVWDRIPVLLVNGDPSSENLRGETDFLEIALQPFGLARVELADLISTRVIQPQELKAELLAQTRVLVLANVRQLSDSQWTQLQSFVRDGGGLLVFPGNRCNTDWYNRVAAGGPDPLLPVPLSALQTPGSKGVSARILAQHFTHPALELFNDPRNGNLGEGEVRVWYRLGAETAGTDAAVLARLDSGDPFLVEKKFGEGRVILAGTAADADWSNLPTRPFYLPLMQRLVTYLASTIYPPRNLEVGQPLVALVPRGEVGKKALLTGPAGNRYELVVAAKGPRGVVEFPETRQPGLYQLLTPDGAVTHFVANTSREESDLAQLTEPEIRAFAKTLGAAYAASWPDYTRLDRARRFGQEIWKPLLWAVLGLVFTELLLQQWFAKRIL